MLPAAQVISAGQSLAPTHSTQRPTSVPHTCPFGQASELTQGVYSLQTLATQSLLAGQSAPTTHATHLPVSALHALPDADVAQSRLVLQRGTGVMQRCSWQVLPESQSRSATHSKQVLAAWSHTLPVGQSRLVRHPSGAAASTPASPGVAITIPLSGSAIVDASKSARLPKAVLPPHTGTEFVDTSVKHKPRNERSRIRTPPFVAQSARALSYTNSVLFHRWSSFRRADPPDARNVCAFFLH